MTAGNIGGQAVEAGIVDQIHLNPVLVQFGSGVRFFGDCAGARSLLEDPSPGKARQPPDL